MGSPRDYKNTIVPNWCPGCGDFGIKMRLPLSVRLKAGRMKISF